MFSDAEMCTVNQVQVVAKSLESHIAHCNAYFPVSKTATLSTHWSAIENIDIAVRLKNAIEEAFLVSDCFTLQHR